MVCYAAALGIAERIILRTMWNIVVVIKDCTLTLTNVLPAKSVDDQVSLKRWLTFRYFNRVIFSYLIIAVLVIMKTDDFAVCRWLSSRCWSLYWPLLFCLPV